jgi:hypothetical protein
VGRHPELLSRDFPQFTFDHLPDVWWHSDDSSSNSDGGGGGSSDGDAGGGGKSGIGGSSGSSTAPPVVVEEPDDVFAARMEQALAWLEARPESSIAVVAHWGEWDSRLTKTCGNGGGHEFCSSYSRHVLPTARPAVCTNCHSPFHTNFTMASAGVLYSLTGGVDFDNCELRTTRLSRLAR